MRLALDVEAQQSFEFLSEQVRLPHAACTWHASLHPSCFPFSTVPLRRCTASARPSRRSRTF